MLAVEELTAGYGESMVLRSMSLRVPEVGLVAVLGSNGVGKTTLLKSIMGLVRPARGRIAYRGVDVTGAPVYSRARSGIGYVPQGREIFPFLSVHENLVLGLEARGIRQSASAERMYETFPLARFRKRRGGDLSGGQQQILALARILATSPELLVLDEPTEGIQPSIVSEIEQAIARILAQGVAILLVEQFADFALSHADYYYVMERGAVAREGQVDDANRAKVRRSITI